MKGRHGTVPTQGEVAGSTHAGKAMQIRYLDGSRLGRALVAGCDFVQGRRAELNRINVYPVPDGDTGTNLALTAAAISDRLRHSAEPQLNGAARAAADAAILGARGNCGMILSHFLLGFAEAVGDRVRIGAGEFGRVLRGATEHVYRSLDRPVEGTIITVMREVADEAEDARTGDYAELLGLLLERARSACSRTPDMLPVLRQAGVVDAGALGFVHLLEGVGAYVEGGSAAALLQRTKPADFAAVAAAVDYPAGSETYRFCTEALVRGDALPDAAEVRAWLRERGDSLIVIRGADLLKVHIHTDEPEAVFEGLRQFGTLATHKAEDMVAQHAAITRTAAGHVRIARRPVSIISDTGCDLPEEIVRAHGIHLVPLLLVFEDGALRDRIDIDAPTFVERLRGGERPTTSQPAPQAFLDGFRRAGEDGEAVLGVILSSALSGTYQSAEAAARRADDLGITLVDSRAATLAQGLLVLRAAELAELGWTPAAIAAELDRVRAQSGLLFTVETMTNLLASGRVGRGQVMIADLFDIRPILGLTADGRVEAVARVRGRGRVPQRMLREITTRVPISGRRIRFGVMHVGCVERAQSFADLLRATYAGAEVIIAPASPVLATHTGPGAWGVAYQVED
jgi:uncharacterized protein